jgi:hypothetical protein
MFLALILRSLPHGPLQTLVMRRPALPSSLQKTQLANSKQDRGVLDLLLEAHPHSHDHNLLKAGHLAQTAGAPQNHLQLKTLDAIRDLRKAIEEGASGAEAEALLLHAIDVAERWVR